MKGCVSTDLGIITIDPEVIAKYAGTVAVECFGIVGMAAVNMKDGFVHLLKRESVVFRFTFLMTITSVLIFMRSSHMVSVSLQ